MKNDVIYLVCETTTQDADGFTISTDVSFEVMADVQSATRTEYYKAANAGINVHLVAVINYADYEVALETSKPKYVKFENVKYKIVRTYRAGKSNDFSMTLQEIE